MKPINKLLFFLFLAIGTFYKAEGLDDIPSPPPGGGGSGPGTPASPIDMYLYALIFIGILFIVYFNKIRQKKVA